jgi:transcriptional regulator with XRE-family HTH domain
MPANDVDLIGIGARIQDLIKERNITAKYLAQNAGINEAVLTGYKKGNFAPSADALIKISKFFSVSIDWLLTGEDQRISSNELAQYKQSNSETMLFELLDAYRAADEQKRLAILKTALDGRSGAV